MIVPGVEDHLRSLDETDQDQEAMFALQWKLQKCLVQAQDMPILQQRLLCPAPLLMDLLLLRPTM